MSVMEGKGFYYPADSAFGPDGRIYVLNRSLELAGRGRGMRVAVCDSSDNYHGEWGSFGDGPGQFMWPSAICVTSDGQVIIADEHLNKVMVFTSGGDFIEEWGTLGSGEGFLDTPSGLAVNEKNELFVSDTYNHRLQVFSTSGHFLRSFGQNEGLEMPWRLSLGPDENVYVADWGNDRICVYTQEGTFLRSFGDSGSGDGAFNKPCAVVSSKSGKIFVCDWGNERVQVFDQEGNFLELTLGESDLSPWAENFLTVNVEEGKARLNSNLDKTNIPFADPTDRHEVSSHIEKLFWSPMSVSIGPDGLLYVTESNRHRIQVFEIG
ncbi:MAG: NHL repeat-containing protein [Chloroflexota bacterium]|nr:NHL repeat-containing protein [Chloroflexota bacterium]